jgi:alpha-D-ribose 1-methylphosphonate 5-triphosphate synthase subunit PhnH
LSIELPGFTDPVLDAQASFRAVLDAMSRPGSLRAAGERLRPPPPLAPATAAVLLTLVDADSPLWLAPPFADVRDWIAFHCGAAIALRIGDAAFAVAPELPNLSTLNAGPDESPEDSATVILQVRGFGRGAQLSLSGAGHAAPATLLVDGLPDQFATAWETNQALYPRGIDLILCSGTTLAALPRSVRIREG